MRVQVRVGEVAGGGGLVDGGAVQIGGLLGDHAGPQQGRRGAQPAEPHARGHDLGEAAEQGRAVGGGVEGGDPRLVGAAEPQFAVGVVLDDPQAVPAGGLGDGPAACGRERAAGRVLEGGNQVEQLGALAGDEAGQRGGVDAVVVGGDRDDPGAGEAEALQGRQVGGVLDQDGVSGLQHGRGDEGQRLLGTGGDQQVLRAGRQSPGGEPGGRGGPQRGVALGGGVLQDPPRALGEHPVVGGPDPVGVEEFRRGQAAREGDHLGPRGEREDLPYGGGADREAAGGEGGNVGGYRHARSLVKKMCPQRTFPECGRRARGRRRGKRGRPRRPAQEPSRSRMRSAMTAACTRRPTPSFDRIEEIRFFTVFSAR